MRIFLLLNLPNKTNKFNLKAILLFNSRLCKWIMPPAGTSQGYLILNAQAT